MTWNLAVHLTSASEGRSTRTIAKDVLTGVVGLHFQIVSPKSWAPRPEAALIVSKWVAVTLAAVGGQASLWGPQMGSSLWRRGPERSSAP